MKGIEGMYESMRPIPREEVGDIQYFFNLVFITVGVTRNPNHLN